MSNTFSIKMPGFDTPMHLPADRINEGVLLAFTHGQCHALALALHELTGAPLRLEVRRDILKYLGVSYDGLTYLNPVPTEALAKNWDHATAEISPDCYLDISGPHLRRFNADSLSYVVATTPEQIYDLSRVYHSGDAPNLEVARHFAPLVLREYEINY